MRSFNQLLKEGFIIKGGEHDEGEIFYIAKDINVEIVYNHKEYQGIVDQFDCEGKSIWFYTPCSGEHINECLVKKTKKAFTVFRRVEL